MLVLLVLLLLVMLVTLLAYSGNSNTCITTSDTTISDTTISDSNSYNSLNTNIIEAQSLLKLANKYLYSDIIQRSSSTLPPLPSSLSPLPSVTISFAQTLDGSIAPLSRERLGNYQYFSHYHNYHNYHYSDTQISHPNVHSSFYTH